MEFREEDHPGDEDGKFTDGSGEGSAAKIRRVEKKTLSALDRKRRKSYNQVA